MTVTAENMPNPAALIVGRYNNPRGYAVSRRTGSPSWLLLWTDGGAGLVSQGAAQVSPGPGDLVVLESGIRQAYRVAEGAERWRFWWVHFQPRPPWRQWLRPFLLGGGCYAITGVDTGFHARIDAAFRRLHADARWPAGSAPPPESFAGNGPAPIAVAGFAAAQELALSRIEEILLLSVNAAVPASLRRPRRDDRIELAEAVIVADPGAPHSVASLARRVALSPSRFAHLFTEQTGRTPMTAVREARLRHASHLLSITELTVAHIAAECGFESPFHFSRLFRAHFGQSPRHFRQG
jgi:AraC family transcriptional regulator, arabinose operon regulatory protein